MKRIKKHYDESDNLAYIKTHIKLCNNFTEIKNNPISKMYKYEVLKYELNGYYSFNLCKNVGKIRLIFSVKEDKLEIIKYILKYLRVKNSKKVYEIDERIYFKIKNDKPELLLLWLEKCYRETLNQNVKKYNKNNIDELVNFIRNMTNKNIFDEKSLIEKFNQCRIALVIQEDIPGSKIRGAFKVHKDVHVIYITYKHNRIADIYIALLHELAHCKKDFNKAKSTNLVSFNNQNEAENETNYPKSFVVYRLAKDKIINYSSSDYQKNNILLNLKEQQK